MSDSPIPIPVRSPDVLEAIAHTAGTPVVAPTADRIETVLPIEGRPAIRLQAPAASPGMCRCGQDGCSDSGRRF